MISRCQQRHAEKFRFNCEMAICRDRVHLKGEALQEQKGRGKPKDLGKKAVLLSGPPGIGKTSSAMIISR